MNTDFFRSTSQLRFQHRCFTGPIPSIGFIPYEGAHYSVVLQQLWLSDLSGDEPQWRDVMVDGVITSARQDAPQRRTDDEIRARIAIHQAAVDEEEDNGGMGNQDWSEAEVAKHELLWVLSKLTKGRQNNMKLINLGWCMARLDVGRKGPKLTICSPSAGEESSYTPAESIEVCGEPNLLALRDALNEAYPPTVTEQAA